MVLRLKSMQGSTIHKLDGKDWGWRPVAADWERGEDGPILRDDKVSVGETTRSTIVAVPASSPDEPRWLLPAEELRNLEPTS